MLSKKKKSYRPCFLPKNFYYFFLLLLLPACNVEKDIIPYEYVDIQINLDNPYYSDLRMPGKAVVLSGGVNGVIVYRNSISEFSAYDRTAPQYCNGSFTLVKLDESQQFAIDSCNGVTYSLSYEGFPTEGNGSRPLKQYRAIYDDQLNMLYISN